MVIFVCLGEIKKIIGNETKKTKTLSTYQENIAWIKSS